ncbi:hypothetical protein ABMA28_012749 [Loxostege sticticalis]|uniref:Nuclease HARBI1 n=1 Tax=Loxostege sticticalis TaxID=481309 RepID=A0ABD0S4Y4_LOXSC
MQSVFNVMVDNYQDHYLEVLENLEDLERIARKARVYQLFLTLRFYAPGCHQLTVGDFCGVSRPTANRVIHRVTAAIASLGHNYIKFPESAADIRKTQVIAALDCTHIKNIFPRGSHAEEIEKVIYLVVRWPGSSHDERIFSACRRHAMFELGTYGDSILVADNRVSSSAESLHNESQIRTRNPIERLFGIWKRRFPVLALVATGVLHKMLQMRGDEMPSDDQTLGLPAPWEEILDHGRIRQQRSSYNTIARDLNPNRRQLISNYFQSLV